MPVSNGNQQAHGKHAYDRDINSIDVHCTQDDYVGYD